MNDVSFFLSFFVILDVYMISSTVSSKILRSIAQKEGFNFIESLTGFKWMANKGHELILNGKTVLFAFEEAIGFMCGTSVLDKDGIRKTFGLSSDQGSDNNSKDQRNLSRVGEQIHRNFLSK